MISTIKYCFDTCAFIEGWHTHYRKKTFPSLWEQISKIIPSGIIVSPVEVYHELRNRSEPIHQDDGDILEWLKPFKEIIFVGSDPSTIMVLPEIVSHLGRSPLRGDRDYADPYVVAFAKAHGCTVITYEKHRNTSTDRKTKVPTLCRKTGVECKNLPDFLHKMPWSF